MSYASEEGPPVATSQSAASVPSDKTAMPGKSTTLTNQLVPLAIVLAPTSRQGLELKIEREPFPCGFQPTQVRSAIGSGDEIRAHAVGWRG